MELNRAIKFADKMVVLPDEEQCLIIETRLDVDKVQTYNEYKITLEYTKTTD